MRVQQLSGLLGLACLATECQCFLHGAGLPALQRHQQHRQNIILKRNLVPDTRSKDGISPYRTDIADAIAMQDTGGKVLTLEDAAVRTEGGSMNKTLVGFLKGLLDTYYGQRDYARFYALETIARVPYFSYLSVLHLYETLGWWRQADYLKIHFAESWNELHHLLIMEELGGNDKFFDRWLAQHTAFFYYWFVCVLYITNPQNAYNLNQHVEEHAFATYDKFLKAHGQELKKAPATPVAKQYYRKDKLYVFNGLHNSNQDFDELDQARPEVETLYDVFQCIRNDEAEHVKTMAAMQDQAAERARLPIVEVLDKDIRGSS